MPTNSDRRETIAIYSIWAIPAMIVGLGFAPVFVYGWFDLATSHEGFFKNGAYGTYALVLGSLVYLLSSALLWKVFRQIFFDGRRVIWAEDRCFIYLGRDYLAVPCSDISKISFSYNNRNQEGIEFLLRNGSKKFMLTGGLTTSTEAIEKRLKEICFLNQL